MRGAVEYDAGKGLLHLRLYVQPNASGNRLVGLYNNEIKIRIRAKAIDSKANHELITFLAAQFGVTKRAICLHTGSQSRHKYLSISRPHQFPNIIQPLL